MLGVGRNGITAAGRRYWAALFTRSGRALSHIDGVIIKIRGASSHTTGAGETREAAAAACIIVDLRSKR